MTKLTLGWRHNKDAGPPDSIYSLPFSTRGKRTEAQFMSPKDQHIPWYVL